MSGTLGVEGRFLGFVALATSLALGSPCRVEFLASENLVKFFLDSNQPHFL